MRKITCLLNIILDPPLSTEGNSGILPVCLKQSFTHFLISILILSSITAVCSLRIPSVMAITASSYSFCIFSCLWYLSTLISSTRAWLAETLTTSGDIPISSISSLRYFRISLLAVKPRQNFWIFNAASRPSNSSVSDFLWWMDLSFVSRNPFMNWNLSLPCLARSCDYFSK